MKLVFHFLGTGTRVKGFDRSKAFQFDEKYHKNVIRVYIAGSQDPHVGGGWLNKDNVLNALFGVNLNIGAKNIISSFNLKGQISLYRLKKFLGDSIIIKSRPNLQADDLFPIDEIIMLGESRGAILAYLLASHLYNNPGTKNIPCRIIAIEPVSGDKEITAGNHASQAIDLSQYNNIKIAVNLFSSIPENYTEDIEFGGFNKILLNLINPYFKQLNPRFHSQTQVIAMELPIPFHTQSYSLTECYTRFYLNQWGYIDTNKVNYAYDWRIIKLYIKHFRYFRYVNEANKQPIFQLNESATIIKDGYYFQALNYITRVSKYILIKEGYLLEFEVNELFSVPSYKAAIISILVEIDPTILKLRIFSDEETTEVPEPLKDIIQSVAKYLFSGVEQGTYINLKECINKIIKTQLAKDSQHGIHDSYLGNLLSKVERISQICLSANVFEPIGPVSEVDKPLTLEKFLNSLALEDEDKSETKSLERTLPSSHVVMYSRSLKPPHRPDTLFPGEAMFVRGQLMDNVCRVGLAGNKSDVKGFEVSFRYLTRHLSTQFELFSVSLLYDSEIKICVTDNDLPHIILLFDGARDESPWRESIISASEQEMSGLRDASAQSKFIYINITYDSENNPSLDVVDMISDQNNDISTRVPVAKEQTVMTLLESLYEQYVNLCSELQFTPNKKMKSLSL